MDDEDLVSKIRSIIIRGRDEKIREFRQKYGNERVAEFKKINTEIVSIIDRYRIEACVVGIITPQNYQYFIVLHHDGFYADDVVNGLPYPLSQSLDELREKYGNKIEVYYTYANKLNSNMAKNCLTRVL